MSIRLFVFVLLLPAIVMAQSPTPTPSEEQIAQELNISVYELRGSKLLQLIQQLMGIKRSERIGEMAPLGALTQAQKAQLRAQRIAARTQLKNLCDDLERGD